MEQTPSPPARPAHLLLGEYGEKVAEDFLIRLGYSIRKRNMRIRHDEVDILAFDPEDQVLVFVEVRTRTKTISGGFLPERAAGEEKRRNLKRAARRWVAWHDYQGGWRVDLVIVSGGRVRHHFKQLGGL